ncbi:hypothetical protein BDR26DRAFT_519501 [Obelidium mucronatum]|nr:hypothetical protein BDR26DRAFT_519501 [Obelidium mucronatum]
MLSPFPSLSRLTNLEYLDLYFNGIYGPLPHFDPLALAKLTDFVVPHNWLTGPISNLAVLTSLTYLEIDDNSFSGPLKPIFQLTNLIDTATVENNLLVGEIDQFTKDWLKKYSRLDEPNCFTTTTGEFHNPQSKLLCPSKLGC